MLAAVVFAPEKEVTPDPTNVPLKPAAPVTVTAVKAEFVADSVRTTVPEIFKVRSAVSVIPPNVALALITAFTVAN